MANPVSPSTMPPDIAEALAKGLAYVSKISQSGVLTETPTPAGSTAAPSSSETPGAGATTTAVATGAAPVSGANAGVPDPRDERIRELENGQVMAELTRQAGDVLLHPAGLKLLAADGVEVSLRDGELILKGADGVEHIGLTTESASALGIPPDIIASRGKSGTGSGAGAATPFRSLSNREFFGLSARERAAHQEQLRNSIVKGTK